MNTLHSGKYISIYGDPKSGLAIMVTNQTDRNELTEIKRWSYSGGSAEIAYWGDNNLLPQDREDILQDNNIVPELIATKRGIILGQKLVAYKPRWENGKEIKEIIEIPAVISDWLEGTDFDSYCMQSAGELMKHGNIFVEMIESETKKLALIKAKSAKRIRAGVQNKAGIIENYFWHGSWGEAVKKAKELPAPVQIPAWIDGQSQTKSMLHLGDPLFHDGYYFWPAYWGGAEWIELSNVIPKFHKANISNGYSIRFHVKIPANYFLDKVKYESSSKTDKIKCIDEATAAENQFIDNMNKFLSGAKNAGRAVYTKFDFAEDMAKEYPGIKIDSITADLKDEALLKLFEKSNDANISAQGIHPSLASIQTQGKLSAGAEIRNALLSYIAIKTPLPRKLILKPLYIAKKMNGWDKDIHFTFEDIEITKLDENHAGVQVVQN